MPTRNSPRKRSPKKRLTKKRSAKKRSPKKRSPKRGGSAALAIAAGVGLAATAGIGGYVVYKKIKNGKNNPRSAGPDAPKQSNDFAEVDAMMADTMIEVK